MEMTNKKDTHDPKTEKKQDISDIDKQHLISKKHEQELGSQMELSPKEMEEMYIQEVFESDWNIAKHQSLIALDLIIIMAVLLARDLIIFAFCRKLGFQIVGAVTAITVIYDMFMAIIPNALTTYFLIAGSEMIATDDFKKFKKLFNQTNVILLFFSAFMIIIFNLVLPFVFKALLSDEDIEVADNIAILLNYMSISIPFFYLFFSYFKLYMMLQSSYILLVSCIISLGFQIGYLFLMIKHFNLPIIGAGSSFTIGSIIQIAVIQIHFYVMKPFPDLIGNPFEDIFDDDFIDVFWNTIQFGSSSFLLYFPFDALPYLGFLISDRAYTALNMNYVLLFIFVVITESYAIPTTIFLNFCLAKKDYINIKRVYKVSAIIIGSYLIILSIILIFTFDKMLALFSSDDTLVAYASTQKWNLIVAFILSAVIVYTNEAILSLGFPIFSIITIFVGRYIICFGLAAILVKVAHFGLSSVILAYNIGNALTIFVNLGFLFYYLKNNCFNYQIELLKREKEGLILEMAQREQEKIELSKLD